jgi:flagellar motor switch/type III secretory pathway protein FliN
MASLQQIGHLGAVPVTIDISLDCGMLAVGQVLGLQAGSVIRCLRAAGDNLDVRIGGRVIAYGEIVPLEGLTGVRIAHVMDPL